MLYPNILPAREPSLSLTDVAVPANGLRLALYW